MLLSSSMTLIYYITYIIHMIFPLLFPHCLQTEEKIVNKLKNILSGKKKHALKKQQSSNWV